jgi:hypothetical protein
MLNVRCTVQHCITGSVLSNVLLLINGRGGTDIRTNRVSYPIMIALPQRARLLQSVTYGLPCPFSRVRFEDSIYASNLSALCQDFPVLIKPLMCKFSRFILQPV